MTDESLAQFERLHSEGLTDGRIASIVGVHKSTVQVWRAEPDPTPEEIGRLKREIQGRWTAAQERSRRGHKEERYEVPEVSTGDLGHGA